MSIKVVPDKSVRSRMNICFRVTHVSFFPEVPISRKQSNPDINQLKSGVDESEKAFLKGAEAQGLAGLKGHRSVGGIRASNYNSISLEGAEKLAAYIELFAEGPKK
jgi:phosphoserine aminotransferase